MKNNKKFVSIMLAVLVLFLISACGNKPNSSSGSLDQVNTKPPVASQESPASPENTPTEDQPTEEQPTDTDEEILIIIDQTPKPIEGHSFDFAVSKLPEGYSLAEMQWVSEKSLIVNSIQDAIAHGGNGEDGFYISGNGQFMGFFYPETMVGEEGKAVFLFKNEQGKELTWKKEITLK